LSNIGLRSSAPIGSVGTVLAVSRGYRTVDGSHRWTQV